MVFARPVRVLLVEDVIVLTPQDGQKLVVGQQYIANMANATAVKNTIGALERTTALL